MTINIKHKAFTLAETLITLGIIGIVASITIPVLFNNYQKTTYVVGLEKAHSMLSQAFQNYLVSQSVDTLPQTKLFDGSGNADFIELNNFVTSYFKTVKICPINDTSCVVEAKYLKYPEQDPFYEFGESPSANTESYNFFTADGLGFSFMLYDKNYCDADACLSFSIDVNGEKAPNRIGRDIFFGFIGTNGNPYPYYSKEYETMGIWGNDYWTNLTTCGSEDSPDIPDSSDGAGCYERIMEDGWEMKY